MSLSDLTPAEFKAQLQGRVTRPGGERPGAPFSSNH